MCNNVMCMGNKSYTGIIVRAEFEGIHYYSGAPEEVSYLRNPHRHIFHVEVEIQTFHDDRELEFIMVKNDLTKQFSGNLDHKSCEMIAKEIQSYIKERYPVPPSIDPKEMTYVYSRNVNVKVFEDNENGGFIREF